MCALEKKLADEASCPPLSDIASDQDLEHNHSCAPKLILEVVQMLGGRR